MCKYSIEEYSCDRKEEHKETGYCIFHCNKVHFKEEEIKKFEMEFWKYFESSK